MRSCRIICSPSWALSRNSSRDSAKEIPSKIKGMFGGCDQGTQEVKRGGRKKMDEWPFQKAHSPLWYYGYQSSWQEPKMGSNVMFSNIPKFDKFGVFIGIPSFLPFSWGFGWREGPRGQIHAVGRGPQHISADVDVNGIEEDTRKLFCHVFGIEDIKDAVLFLAIFHCFPPQVPESSKSMRYK